MKKISRRQFIGTSAMGLVAAAYLPSRKTVSKSTPFGWPLSFQSYGVKDLLGEDFSGTMKKLHDIGYSGIEMCSPKGYEKAGFAPLMKYKAADLKKIIGDSGLFCKSSHFQNPEIKADALPTTIEFAHGLGLKDVVCSAAWLPENASLDDWKKFADEMNQSGEVLQKAGLKLGYHNHSIGPVVEGRQLYDILMELFDPKFVEMQFQVACVSEGFDVVEYIAKYSGRYFSLHMHDWDPDTKKIVAIGKGVVDWTKLLTTAKKGGLADYGMIVEIETDKSGDPFQGLVESYQYLQTLNL
jgi:sugar phosphate isomerase/epimerase